MAVKIGLDAGHGLRTAGKQTPDGIKEWTLNDKVRDKVVSMLSEYDVEIIHTDHNEGNTDESLGDRLNRYLNAGVKAFVSIHHNAFTGDWNSATGVEIYTDRNPTAEDIRLAQCIYKRLSVYTGMKDRGMKQEDWYVINQDRIPAVLTEGGFMDNREDYKIITSDAGQAAYARAVAEGLVEFLGLKKNPAVPSAPGSAGVPFLINVDKVEAGDVLNIRREPNADAEKTGELKYNDSNDYTIVEERNGWGRLKSGIGWIHLYYTKPAGATGEISSYYAKYTGDSYKIDTVFEAVGVEAKFRGNPQNRLAVAQANGIENYTGTQMQNLALISLARNGKLKKI